MRSMVRAKGVERTYLVSDAVSVAGLAPGRYRLFDDIEVDLRPEGRLELAGTPLLAGAVTALPTCLRNAVRYADVSIADAVRMVTLNPSRLLRLGETAGHERLSAGMAANLTQFRLTATGEVEVARTIVAGTLVYEA
jgi:N-acetylglucosamine-6-phosphate deacetylase